MPPQLSSDFIEPLTPFSNWCVRVDKGTFFTFFIHFNIFNFSILFYRTTLRSKASQCTPVLRNTG